MKKGVVKLNYVPYGTILHFCLTKCLYL